METDDATLVPHDYEMKEAEFSYFTSDIQDVQSKIKRRSYFRASSSEKSLLCLHSERGEEFMRYKPREITRIEEPGKRFLCVEYGPVNPPMYMLLDFNDSRESLDEWDAALRQMMGLKSSFRDRSSSEISKRRQSPTKTKRAISAIQQINKTISEHGDSVQVIPNLENANQQPTMNENGFESPTFTAASIVESCAKSSLGSDGKDAEVFYEVDSGSPTGSEAMSSIGSLKSDGEDEPWRWENKLKQLHEERDKEFVEYEIPIEDLHRLTLSDYKGCVYVSDGQPGSPHTMYIGDRLIQVDSESITTAQDASDLICRLKERETQSQQVLVRVERFPKGNICVIRHDVQSWTELGISLEGNMITSTGGEFRLSCDPAWISFEGQRSKRSISAVNDHAIPLHATTKEVTDLIKEAMDEELPIAFHVHPTEFLKELAASSGTNL